MFNKFYNNGIKNGYILFLDKRTLIKYESLYKIMRYILNKINNISSNLYDYGSKKFKFGFFKTDDTNLIIYVPFFIYSNVVEWFPKKFGKTKIQNSLHCYIGIEPSTSKTGMNFVFRLGISKQRFGTMAECA